MQKKGDVMKLLGAVLLLVMLGARAVLAQVLTPSELDDPSTQQLQQKHFKTLMEIGSAIETHHFPYPFYLSRVLDIDLAKVAEVDQRSIRFASYQHQTVLEITGNYYASYSGELLDANARLKETFTQVLMPLLNAEVPRFPDDSEFSAFAIEVSHHVRRKLAGITSENPENVTIIIPVAVAQKLMDARTDDQKQGAILDAEVFLNGEPYALWLKEGGPTEEWHVEHAPRPVRKDTAPTSSATPAASSPVASSSVLPDLLKTQAPTMPIVTPEALARLHSENETMIDTLLKGMDEQAHFIAYAAPAFIGFRQRAYLQLSLATPVQAPSGTSRYKLAALAFDEHIAHLVRPVLTYMPEQVSFDGIEFSSVLHLSDGSTSEAVEFFFPIRVMHCFAAFECTGQQLIDSGTVVINGERAALDLQVAEGRN
jgi:hypothetical protein